MVHWGTEYSNTTLEEYEFIHADATFDCMSKDYFNDVYVFY